MRSTQNTAGGTVLVCDPSFLRDNGQNCASAFPVELLNKLSSRFNFQVLETLDTMPMVFIEASGRELGAMDVYLAQNYGSKVSVEGSNIIQTDITSSPT